MSDFIIRKGRDIKIRGQATKEIRQMPYPSKVAIQPPDFRGARLRLLVREGDAVKAGTPLLVDKNNPDMVIVSPASGKVAAIVRGEKRSLQQIVVETDGKETSEPFKQYRMDEIRGLSRSDLIAQLLKGGLWPVIRQRPFSNIANPGVTPKSIFIQAINTEPLALDYDFILNGKEALFQVGLDIVGKLTDGKVHLCHAAGAGSKALTAAQNVERHTFSGPHPAGNVSTLIHYVDPIRKGDVVWYLSARDVLRIAAFFMEGKFPSRIIVAMTGEGIKDRAYVSTVVGASVQELCKNNTIEERLRYISGSVLSGRNVGSDGFVGFYDSQVTVIPEGGHRRFLGWLAPGFHAYSLSRTFVSSFLPAREASLDTDTHGSHRAIVLNHLYDDLVPLDIMTYFLLRAVIAGDIEEAEKMGILECDEEDFALCAFACPSKTDVGGIIRQGLDVIEKEG